MRTYPHPLVGLAARAVFGLRLASYRLRYPASTFERGVVIIGRLRIRQGTRVHLGAHCRVRQRVIINGGGTVEVGAHTLLNGCWIQARDRVEIGEWSLLADCGITDTDHHELSPRRRHLPPSPRVAAPVRVGRNAWIGLGALLLKGAEIGEDSVVGAGSVVRGTVPAGVVVTGNPAAVVKHFRPEERGWLPLEDRSSPVEVRQDRRSGDGAPRAAYGL
jgi:acetyltransferase-like isoleucine patch superfamily enzyme